MAARRTVPPLADPGLRNILEDLRKRILDGRYPAGTRLPAVRELAATYRVAGTTIHRCLQELTAAGFLSTHGRNGTRVVDYPPHRHRYGLVLPELPLADGTYQQRHWQANAVSAALLSTGPGCQIEIFHGVSSHPELTQHQQLLAALAECRLAGLIMVDEERVQEWLVPSALSIPVVGVTPVAKNPAIGNLKLELTTFLRQALHEVAQRGYRRPAIVLNTDALPFMPLTFQAAAQLGIPLAPQHIHCLPTSAPEWSPYVVAHLFQGPVCDHPDALIIADEIAIPGIESALAQNKKNSLFQVHMTNHPLPPLAKHAVLQLGWDHRLYLQKAISLIDAWNRDRLPIGEQELPLTPAIGL
jgi:hypothetical protein